MSDDQVRVQALADQMWAMLDKHLPMIEHVSNNGASGVDDAFIQMVFSGVAGELKLRRGIVKELDCG